ncbi:MAG: hypothetical protein KAI26_08450 [Nanoarchaeota archaeon]|nr:hypothetical protein [Nanoarchaeota archaeon]
MQYYISHMLIDILSLLILFMALSISVVLAIKAKAKLRRMFVYISIVLALFVFNEIFYLLAYLFFISPNHMIGPILHVCMAIFLLLALILMREICQEKRRIVK